MLDLSFYLKNIKYKNNNSLPYCNDIKSVTDETVNYFINKYFSPNDIKLIQIATKNNVTQEDFDTFINSWDIEVEGGHKALFLSYFMKTHPDIIFPQYVEPRLKGLLQFYRFKNMKLISHFKKICTKLRENNIDILIIKGGAFRHLQPEYPRVMGDIDIIVRNKKDFEKAKNIVSEMGYTYEEFPHSIDLHKEDSMEGILDIHHRLDILADTNDDIIQDFFKRASKNEIFFINDIFLPSNEDLMFITLTNMVKNMCKNTSLGSIIYAINECKYLIESKPNFDWNIVKENTIKTHCETNIYITTKLINKLVPNLIPEMFADNYRNLNTLLMYNQIFLPNLKEKSHTLKLTNIFKSWQNFREYFTIKPMYFMYKRKMIRKNPKITELILKNSEINYEN